LFGKCGFNCGRCPSYKGNIRTYEDRRRCSDGWYKYHGFRISAEKIISCDGCQAPDEENPVRYWKYGCYVRKCAVRNGVETCAHCSAYPCEDLIKIAGIYSKEESKARLGGPIPEEDYLTFIEPYEGIKHLDRIRASINPDEIVEATKFSVKPRIVEFPDDLPFSSEEIEAFKALHKLITSIKSIEGVTYARMLALQKRNNRILKLL